jgi:hypothetical protein
LDAFLLFAMCATYPTPLIFLALIILVIQTWWGVQIVKLLIMLFSQECCCFLSLRSKYSPQWLTLVHLHPISCLNVRDQYKTTYKIIDFYIWIITFLDSREEGKRFPNEWQDAWSFSKKLYEYVYKLSVTIQY